MGLSRNLRVYWEHPRNRSNDKGHPMIYDADKYTEEEAAVDFIGCCWNDGEPVARNEAVIVDRPDGRSTRFDLVTTDEPNWIDNGTGAVLAWEPSAADREACRADYLREQMKDGAR